MQRITVLFMFESFLHFKTVLCEAHKPAQSRKHINKKTDYVGVIEATVFASYLCPTTKKTTRIFL